MAQYTAYANYVIYFSVQADYDAAIAFAGGTGIQMAPANAAAFFGLTFPPAGGPLDPIKGLYGFPPYGIPGPGGVEVQHPLASGVFLENDVDSVLVPGQAGNPASVFPVGPDMLLVWFGIITKSAQETDSVDPAFIPRRRWIAGFELGVDFEGGTGVNVDAGCRDASRTIDGVGLAYRGANNVNPQNRTVNAYITGFTTKESWERFYVRIRVLPTSNISIWRCHGAGGQSGATLKITPAGGLAVFEVNSAGVQTLIGTIGATLAINNWFKIDCVFHYGNGAATPGDITVFVNGTNIGSFSTLTGTGLYSNVNHTDSDLGKQTSDIDATAEFDLDDWICADIPVNGAFGEDLTSIDFLAGSHVRAVYSEVFVQASWTPAASGEVFNQGHNSSQGANASILSSTISGAALEGETGVVDEQDSIGITAGAFAALIGIRSRNTGATDGQLGYRIAGGAAVMATINELTSETNRQVLYRGEVGIDYPISIVPYSVRFTKSADGNTGVVIALQSIVEYIGMWGVEDDISGQFLDPPRLGFTHNSRYANSMWGFIGPVPDGPVYAVGGTYVGTGANTTIVLPAPCHFLMIRRSTGSFNSTIWFGSGMGGHTGTLDRIIAQNVVRLFTDPATDISVVKITGTNAEMNALGITYQYVAFCDPGMRFNFCTSFNHPSVLAVSNNPLINSEFQADGGFAIQELLGLAGASDKISYKGPGHVANDGTAFSGTAIANWGNFQLGNFISRAGLHPANATQVALSLWKTIDEFCGNVMVQILSYTGNGSNPRTITLTPASGRFPLLAIVMPASGVNPTFFRDPSHAGSDSSNINNGSISTVAITGGAIDSITVNSALNAAGVVYNVFVIPGSDISWANGVYFPPNCEPPNIPWPVPPVDPPEIAILGQGGLVLNGQTGLLLLKDLSGIYTLVPGKKEDTLYDRQTGVTSVDMAIPNPHWKTGYLGG